MNHYSERNIYKLLTTNDFRVYNTSELLIHNDKILWELITSKHYKHMQQSSILFILIILRHCVFHPLRPHYSTIISSGFSLQLILIWEEEVYIVLDSIPQLDDNHITILFHCQSLKHQFLCCNQFKHPSVIINKNRSPCDLVSITCLQAVGVLTSSNSTQTLQPHKSKQPGCILTAPHTTTKNVRQYEMNRAQLYSITFSN